MNNDDINFIEGDSEGGVNYVHETNNVLNNEQFYDNIHTNTHRDYRIISPAIGVTLMVIITVALAAIIAWFVFSLSGAI